METLVVHIYCLKTFETIRVHIARNKDGMIENLSKSVIHWNSSSPCWYYYTWFATTELQNMRIVPADLATEFLEVVYMATTPDIFSKSLPSLDGLVGVRGLHLQGTKRDQIWLAFAQLKQHTQSTQHRLQGPLRHSSSDKSATRVLPPPKHTLLKSEGQSQASGWLATDCTILWAQARWFLPVVIPASATTPMTLPTTAPVNLPFHTLSGLSLLEESVAPNPPVDW